MIVDAVKDCSSVIVRVHTFLCVSACLSMLEAADHGKSFGLCFVAYVPSWQHYIALSVRIAESNLYLYASLNIQASTRLRWQRTQFAFSARCTTCSLRSLCCRANAPEAMSKKRSRPLGDIIRLGLVADGELLRYVVSARSS